MRKLTLALVLLLALAVPAWSQSVKLPAEVKGEPGGFVRVPAETDGKEVRWLSPDAGLNVFPVELLRDSKTAVVVALKAGRYRLYAWSAKGDVPSDAALCVVIIGDAPPVPPTPPVPPDPTPPTPPEPPAPIPGAGLRVLMVYETKDKAKYPPAQLSVMSGTGAGSVREYLNKHCVTGPDNWMEWRIWDKDVDATAEARLWQDALARAKTKATSLPWIVISNGKTGFEGPLPATTAETLSLLRKYGGE